MKENLISKLTFDQAVNICRCYNLGNIKLINQLSKAVIVSDYINPANLSYKQLIKGLGGNR